MFKYEPVAKKFYDGLAEGRFLGLKCTCCGHIEFPPYPACNECGHYGNEWVDLTDEEVTVDEIYSIPPMMTIEEFMPYAPLFSCECHMDGGIELSLLIFGVKKKEYKTLREQVPLKGKLVVMPMEGYNSFAVSINGAVPKRKENAGHTVDRATVLQALSKDKGINDADKPDNGIDGSYKLKLEMMGREQTASMTVSAYAGKLSGYCEAMGMQFEIDGTINDSKAFEFSVEARGSELIFSGTIADDRTIAGSVDFGGMKMKLTGEPA